MLPVLVSLGTQSADLLFEMASEMNVSLDELFSSILEDSVIGLTESSQFSHDVVIPDSCSTEHLLKYLRID